MKSRYSTLCAGLALTTVATAIPVDFEGFAAGTWITTQYPGFTVSAINNNSNHPDKAIIFDSANPTGGDSDLATPGYHVSNIVPLGKVLIIAEDDVDNNTDGLVDDPDDEAAGGTIRVDFDSLMNAGSITVLDIDGSEGSSNVKLYNSGSLVSTIDLLGLGDNSMQTHDFGGFEFDRMDVNFVASGAVGAFYAVPEPTTVALSGLGAAALARRVSRRRLRTSA